jgi:hypothetical protein
LLGLKTELGLTTEEKKLLEEFKTAYEANKKKVNQSKE